MAAAMAGGATMQSTATSASTTTTAQRGCTAHGAAWTVRAVHLDGRAAHRAALALMGWLWPKRAIARAMASAAPVARMVWRVRPHVTV